MRFTKVSWQCIVIFAFRTRKMRVWQASHFAQGSHSMSSDSYSYCSVMSNSLRSHGLYPVRLLCPWDSQARILEWVVMLSSRGSFWSRERTYISCIVRQILYEPSHVGSPKEAPNSVISELEDTEIMWPVEFNGPQSTWLQSLDTSERHSSTDPFSYLYTLISLPLPSHPTPPGHHRAPGWVACIK